MQLQESNVCTEDVHEKRQATHRNAQVLHHNTENCAPHTLHFIETTAISLCKTTLFLVECVFPFSFV